MASMRGTAADAYEDKLERMGLGSGGRGTKIRTAAMGEDEGIGHVLPAEDGTQGTVPNGYADQYKSERANEAMVSEKRAKPRLDRPAYKKGGRVKGHTTVNVIVAPQQPKPAAPPMLPPGGLPPPPPMSPGPPMGGPPGGPMGGLPGGGAMPRKKGGRVPMDAGAGGGLGRLQKLKDYGANAKKIGGK